MSDALLHVDGLCKSFGALRATDQVGLEVRQGETHAIIGPNGAGKTTLIGQLAGNLRPDAGTIRFAAEDITALAAPARSRRGLARSFQITSVYRDFSALDNVTLAVQAHAGSSFRFWRPARSDESLRAPARAILAEVGLGDRARRARGEPRPRRAAPARDRDGARDEAAAHAARRTDGGDGHRRDRRRTTRFLAELKGRHTMVLVEHDMDAVFALADRISVLVYGRIIATGTPAEIRANPEVRSAYLGEEAEA